jgi:hypothetical protein
MIELPQPGPNETIGQYIARLMDTKIINATQIPLAINKFNKK